MKFHAFDQWNLLGQLSLSLADLARLVGIKQPSVTLWAKRGLGLVRENDLRFRFPELQVWKRFPPLTDTADKSDVGAQ